MRYDYLIVGAGLFGGVVAHELSKQGYKCLVIDKRNHVGGNVYTENIDGINVHKYGAHIFHTNDEGIWKYVQQFAKFNNFINSPMANYHGTLYSLPFSMYTFNQMWGVVKPQEALEIINRQRKEITCEPRNLEEQAISLVGRDIYEKLIKGYTEKQWGRSCRDLPPFIIKRLPVRFTFNNNYFNANYQGIPIGGYTKMIDKMLDGIEVRLGIDFCNDRRELNNISYKIIYSGPIDTYYDYCLGPLEYRSVRFETQLIDNQNFQGNAVVNYTDNETPWTRIIEHKWFELGKDIKGQEISSTIISKEFSSEWHVGEEPYYPINDEKNAILYQKYYELSLNESNVFFGGRLAEYKYYDMDQVITRALSLVKQLN